MTSSTTSAQKSLTDPMHHSSYRYLGHKADVVYSSYSIRFDKNSSEEVAYMKKVPYASAVGSIMYAVRCTRSDVAFAQNLVSRYQQNLVKLHWVAVKHIMKYLRNTRDKFLVYGGNQIQNLMLQGSVMRPGNVIKMIRSLRRVMSLSSMEEQ
ncbi:hypothetical protein Tco_0169010 [Tanacetum coccineum]